MSNEEVSAEFRKIDAAMTQEGRILGARRRLDARYLRAGGLSDEDIGRMVRGQILGGDKSPLPCSSSDPPRKYSQLALDLDADVQCPRNQLRCPLEERARSGDVTALPCCRAMEIIGQESLGEPDPPEDEQEERARDVAALFVKNDVCACELLDDLAGFHIREVLGLPADWQHPEDSDVLRRRLQREREEILGGAGRGQRPDGASLIRHLLRAGAWTWTN